MRSATEPQNTGAQTPLTQSSDAPPFRRLGFGAKVMYGLGAIPFGIKDQGFQTLLLLYYNQVLGLSAIVASTALLIALLIDAFIDPIIGQMSDTWRSTKWGRRHPFMYFSIVPIAITYFALWNPPDLSQQALFIYLIIASIAVRTALSIYEIPSASMLPELTEDYDQRTSLISYRTLCAVFGGLVMNLAVFMVFLRPDTVHGVGQLNPSGYHAYSIAATFLMVALILASAIGTHRLIPTFRVPPVRRVTAVETAREMLETLSNPSILVLLAAGVFSGIGLGMIGGLTMYITTFYWDMSAAEIAWIAGASVPGIFIAGFAATPLARALGKKRACILMFGIAVVVGCTPVLLRQFGLAPPNHSPALLTILMLERALGSASGIAAGIIAGSMIADTVEDTEIRTGRRSEGLLTAVNSFVAKAVSGVGIFFAGAAISIVNFPAHARPNEVSTSVLTHLVMIDVVVVVVSLGLSMLCISGYRISRKDHADNLRKLAARTTQAG